MPCSQATVLTVPSYPLSWTTQLTSLLSLEEPECWFALLPLSQLYFTCHLRPRDGRLPIGSSTYGEDDTAVQSLFYSTFEVLDLPGSGPLETRRVMRLYKPSLTPILYVGPISNECPWCPCFSAETLRRPSSTFSLTCRGANSHQAVESSPRSRAGREAMSMRPTNGSGALGRVSLIWGFCQFQRQRSGEWLRCKKGLGMVMPRGPKGGVYEARNEIGLTCLDIHGITMVVLSHEKASMGYLYLCRYPKY